MTRDLHSAILFCAFLSSKPASNNHLQASICASARPIFSTLFQTNKERKKLRSQRLFRPPQVTNGNVQTLQPGFFDPSYISHDYKMKCALKSLKSAANSNSNSPTFLHPRVKKFHRFTRHQRSERAHTASVRGVTRPVVEILLRRRAMSTEADAQPLLCMKPMPSAIQLNEILEPSKSLPPRPQKSNLLVDRLRIIERLDLQRLADQRDAAGYLKKIYPVLSLPSSIRNLSVAAQIRLCLALLLSAAQLSFIGDRSQFIRPPLQLEITTGLPGTSAWALGHAMALWNAVDPAEIQSKHDLARYHIAHAQFLAFQGRVLDAEKAMEPHSNLKDELGVNPSWLVLHTYRIIFLISTLQRHSLKDTLRICLRKAELSSFLLGNPGISTLHLTKKYGSLLQAQIFDAFDQLPDPHSWYTTLSSHPQRTHDQPFNEEEHRYLGSILLHYLVNRLNDMRPVNSASRASSKFVTTLIDMLDTFDQYNYPVPYQIQVQSSLELSRLGYAEEAERRLNNASTPPSDSLAYKLSALLAVAARQGDILRALELVELLRGTGSLQKRDIRQLVLAYTRAPVYEVLPVEPGSADNSPDVLGTNSYVAEVAIPDRITDAEEIFIKLVAPYGPSIVDYSIILDAYARRGDVENVNRWIGRMLDAGFLPDDIPWEKALRAFAVAGNIQGVVRMLDHMQGVQTRRQQKGANGNGTGEKQHRWSNTMNASVFNILLELMARRRDPLGANRLWRNVVFAGLVKPNSNSAVKLLRAHAEAGHWNGVIKAWKYLETMDLNERVASPESGMVVAASTPHHTVAVYNTVLRAYIALGTPFTVVINLFGRMKASRVIPDSFTYTMAIISATDCGDMETAMSLFQQMEEQEVRRGLPSGWQEVDRGTPVSDGSLPQRGPSTIDYRPIYALTYLFHGYLRQKNWPKARSVYHLIERRGLKLLPLTYAVIIKSYTVSGARGNDDEGLKVAENFLNSLTSGWGSFQLSEGDVPLIKKERPSHDVAAYSPLMVDYVRQRKPEEVERLFEQMVRIGGDPSITGLTMLMDVYRRVGDVDRVRDTWRTVLQVAMGLLEKDDLARQISTLGDDGESSEPTVEDKSLDLEGMDRYNYPRSSRAMLCYPFSIFLDAVSAAGFHEEVAIEWKRLRDAGFSFDAHNWNHLVTVLVRAGELERAFEVVEGVIIPYALSSKQLASGTPLSWERKPEEGDDEEGDQREQPLVQEETVKWGRRKIAMKYESGPARRAALEMADLPGSTPDFVHELKLMQGVSRNWYQWKPHKSVLKTLSKALLHLEGGRLVLPLLPPGIERDSAEVKVGSGDRAHVLLERLRIQYPRTCKLAYDQVPAR